MLKWSQNINDWEAFASRYSAMKAREPDLIVRATERNGIQSAGGAFKDPDVSYVGGAVHLSCTDTEGRSIFIVISPQLLGKI